VSDAGPSIVDLHSHLVPGVDDGARSIADAMDGLGRMVEKGVGTIITTPHLDGSLTRDPNLLQERLAAVDAAFAELKDAASTAHPTLSLMRGHEVKLDIPDPDLSDPRIRLGNSNFILIEWPRLLIPPETPTILARLGAAGVRLLIAHPERYGGYDQELHLVAKWRKEGAFLQANFGSLIGRYGLAPRAIVFRLLERGWVDCLATDFHARPHLRLFSDAARQTFERLGAERAWEMLTQVNPELISRGEEPLPVPPVEGGCRLVDRVRSLFGAG